MKDNFSSKSRDYRKYRPAYPPEIFDYIKEHLKGFDKAWDCGTGNGQVAGELSSFFREIEATDISENQLKNAVKKENINYSIQPAEETNFNDNEFDLVICAQAVHWFNFDNFYAEVKRCLKPEGIIVILGYGLFRSNPGTNKVIESFYNQIIGPYWDSERNYLDENYQTIPFPFVELPAPEFQQTYEWSIEHLLGYLRTWSAVKHYKRINNEDPLALIEDELRKVFGTRNRVIFPVLFKMGKIRNPDQ